MLSLAVAGAAGCAAFGPKPPVAYTPQPARIQNPKEALKALIVTTGSTDNEYGCEYSPEYNQSSLIVKAYCRNGAFSPAIRFDKIQKIELFNDGSDKLPKYRMAITHGDNLPSFHWKSPSLDDIQHLEDAVVAVQQELAGGATPPAGSK